MRRMVLISGLAMGGMGCLVSHAIQAARALATDRDVTTRSVSGLATCTIFEQLKNAWEAAPTIWVSSASLGRHEQIVQCNILASHGFVGVA